MTSSAATMPSRRVSISVARRKRVKALPSAERGWPDEDCVMFAMGLPFPPLFGLLARVPESPCRGALFFKSTTERLPKRPLKERHRCGRESKRSRCVARRGALHWGSIRIRRRGEIATAPVCWFSWRGLVASLDAAGLYALASFSLGDPAGVDDDVQVVLGDCLRLQED